MKKMLSFFLCLVILLVYVGIGCSDQQYYIPTTTIEESVLPIELTETNRYPIQANDSEKTQEANATIPYQGDCPTTKLPPRENIRLVPVTCEPTIEQIPQVLSYIDRADGQLQLMEINQAMEMTQLTNGRGHVFNFWWSPNGTRLIVKFYLEDVDKYEYWLYESGEISGQLDIAAKITDLSWAPDNQRFVFIADSRMIIGDIVEKTYEELFQMSEIYEVAWSPIDDVILFSGINEGGWLDLFFIQANGENFLKVTYDEYSERRIDWSPNGQFVSFIRDEEMGPFLYITDFNTDIMFKLDNLAYGSNIMWSTNSIQISYLRLFIDDQASDSYYSPCIVNVESFEKTCYEFETTDVDGWSFDDSYLLLWDSQSQDSRALWLLEMETGVAYEVIRRTDVRTPKWVPNQ